MRRTAALLASLAMLAIAAGCGGGGRTLPPREQGMQSTYDGSYQVKGVEDGRVQGVGIYDRGSFRILVEGTPRMVIHDEQGGENWMVSLSQKTYEPISYGEALLKAGFMPHLSMKAYFDLEQFWEGPEFRMDAPDGRSIRAYLNGPGCLPSLWEAVSQGKAFKSISWEYRRVDHVSPENFRPPEGLTPKAQQ